MNVFYHLVYPHVSKKVSFLQNLMFIYIIRFNIMCVVFFFYI